jgi:hypothetical protein
VDFVCFYKISYEKPRLKITEKYSGRFFFYDILSQILEEIRMDNVFRNSDGRRFARVPFKRSVRFSTFNSERSNAHIAQDLSQGGLRMLSSEFIPIHSIVSVQIQLKDREKVMDVQGRVVWVRYNPMTETYQMGLEFMEDAAFQRTMISEFIQSK